MLLDRNRLNQQVNEARQIVSALRHGGGWRNHPAVRAWRGHEAALQLYHDVMMREWIRRDYVNNRPAFNPPLSDVVMPSWLGGEVHSTHRSQLLAKMPEWYGRFGWTEEAGLPYVWPVP